MLTLCWRVCRYRQLLEMTADRRLVVVPTFQTWVMESAKTATAGTENLLCECWNLKVPSSAKHRLRC